MLVLCKIKANCLICAGVSCRAVLCCVMVCVPLLVDAGDEYNKTSPPKKVGASDPQNSFCVGGGVLLRRRFGFTRVLRAHVHHDTPEADPLRALLTAYHSCVVLCLCLHV